MRKKTEIKLQDHLISFAKTFAAGFILSIGIYLLAFPNFTWSMLDSSFVYSVVLSGVRGGVRVLWEDVFPKLTAWAKEQLKSKKR